MGWTSLTAFRETLSLLYGSVGRLLESSETAAATVAVKRSGPFQSGFQGRASVVAVGVLLTTAGSVQAADSIEFNRDIRPILSANCFACHGFDAHARQGELRLDEPENALRDRGGYAVIVPGNLDESEFWTRIISEDPDSVMPPPSAHTQLKPEEKELLQRWIEQGAKFQKHWAFEKPEKSEIPTPLDQTWARNEIDQFLISKMEQQGLQPRPEADKATLIRRVSFALTGLPPAPAEVQEYFNDASEKAYENMVERYLNSPHYGEEMARHWLDVARYADTHGLHLDNEREMWAYRDWVVAAFNRDQPFDQFSIEQLAGDLLPNPTQEQLIATGFNRCNVTTSEGGSIDDELLFRYAVERASTTIETWMGLTGGCAVCHDHKYDPISAEEFYSMYAFFYSSADPAMDGNVKNTRPFLSLETPEQKEELAELAQSEHAATLQRDQIAQALNYQDPADSPSDAVEVADVFLDDLLPHMVNVRTESRDPVKWTTHLEMPIPSGFRAWKQAAADAYYDHLDGFGTPWIMPEEGVISVWVRTDLYAPPQSILLEFATGAGTRRVVWGDASLLGAGEIGSPERFRAGDLPEPGVWHQLSVTAAELNWPAHVPLNALIIREYGGIVSWDQLTFSGKLKPQDDPKASFKKWWSLRSGQDTPHVPGELNTLLKQGPDAEITTEQRRSLLDFYLKNIARNASPELADSQLALQTVKAKRATLADSIPGTFVFGDLPNARQAHIMIRGEYDKPGDAVEPATLKVLPELKSEQRLTRLDLANWLMSPEQPLTSRVAVNRFWQQFFGTGLVETSADFGSQGTPPSHPELLDWLAVHYQESGWKTRDLVRLIVTSAAYRQNSGTDSELLEKDPKNRLLAHGPRLRLDAEQVRDNALFTAGMLNLKMGGKGIKFYQPSNIWEPVGYQDSNTRFYLQDHGEDLYRRSLYAFLKRTAPPPFMSNFDGPNREQACSRRERSNTPLQALQLMNDIQHVEAARGLATRVLREGGSTDKERLAYAWKLVLVREPEERELLIVQRTLDDHQARFSQDTQAAEALIRVGESAPPTDMQADQLAAYTMIANLILNLDETIVRN